MFSILMIAGFVKMGSVDYISNGYAVIEYVENSVIRYIDVSLNNAECQPEEGDTVFFDHNKIVKCLHKP